MSDRRFPWVPIDRSREEAAASLRLELAYRAEFARRAPDRPPTHCSHCGLTWAECAATITTGAT